MDLRFKNPFTMIVAGPSSCGKSYFVRNLLLHVNKLCDIQYNKIYWCYSVWQPLYDELKAIENIVFIEGLIEMENINSAFPSLLIVDDLMGETENSLTDIFTKFSHHKNMSAIYITQNIFHKGKGNRDISLNTHYMVIFKNPRDRAQFGYLARQILPKSSNFLQEIYEDATKRPHGYILLDLKQDTPDSLRYRTNIFPNEEVIIYKEKVFKH
jgi:hypothetical protein